MRSLWGSLLLALGLALPISAETFHNPRHISIPSNPAQIGTADFNGDGRPDFYYVDPHGFNVMLANSDGSYVNAPPVALGSTPVGCYATDLSGDGLADIVCFTNESDPHPGVAIFIGKGNGTFQQSQMVYPGVFPGLCCSNYHLFIFVAVGDMNGDGHQDVIFWDYYTGYLYTLFLDGTGLSKGIVSYQYTVPNGSWGAEIGRASCRERV